MRLDQTNINISIFCIGCGNEVKIKSIHCIKIGDYVIHTEPCEHCISEASEPLC